MDFVADVISSSTEGPFMATKYPPFLTKGIQNSLKTAKFATARETAISYLCLC